MFGELALSVAAAQRRTAAIRRIVDEATAQGRALRDIPDGPMADLVGSMLVGGTRQVLLDHLDGGRHADLDALADDLTALWLALGDAAAGSVRPAP